MAITYNDRKKIEKCLQEGKSKDEIALIIGCSRATVYNEIHRGEVPSDVYRRNIDSIERMLKEGKTIKEIADTLPVSERTVYNYMYNGRIPGIDKETMRKTEITMFNDGCVIIPKWLRNKMNLSEGQRFRIELYENEIRLLPVKVD